MGFSIAMLVFWGVMHQKRETSSSLITKFDDPGDTRRKQHTSFWAFFWFKLKFWRKKLNQTPGDEKMCVLFKNPQTLGGHVKSPSQKRSRTRRIARHICQSFIFRMVGISLSGAFYRVLKGGGVQGVLGKFLRIPFGKIRGTLGNIRGNHRPCC